MVSRSFLMALVFALSGTAYVEAQDAPPPSAPSVSAPRVVRRRPPPRRVYRAPAPVAAPVVAPPAQHLLSSIKFDSNLGEVLVNLNSQAKQVLERARSQNDYLLMRIGADMSLFLANFEGNNANLKETPLKSLEPATQQFITRLDTLFLSILKNQDRELDINELLATHNELLTKAPTIKHLPTVYSYSPYILKMSDIKKPVVVTIKGLSFNYGAAKLLFRGVTYAPTSESAGVLVFEIDAKELEVKSAESSLIQASLVLQKPAVDGGVVEPLSVPVTFMVMPMQAGKFALEYSHIETVNKSEIKSAEFTHVMRSGESECKVVTTKAANPSRVIKNLHEIFQGGEGGSSQVTATTINDFTIKLCVQKANKLASGAQVTSIWQWEEHWQDHQERQEKLEGVILEGKDDITIDKLPPALHKFALVATGLDNRNYIFNGSGDKGLFTLRFNPAAKQMVLGTRSTEARLQ